MQREIGERSIRWNRDEYLVLDSGLPVSTILDLLRIHRTKWIIISALFGKLLYVFKHSELRKHLAEETSSNFVWDALHLARRARSIPFRTRSGYCWACQ